MRSVRQVVFSSALFLLTAIILLSGCGTVKRFLPADAQEKVYRLDDYGITVTASSAWEETEADNLDLQLVNRSVGMYMSMYGFADMDLAADSTPADLFETQNSQILDNRENVQLLEELKTEEYADKTVLSILYSAEREGTKNYYRAYLLDFKESDKMAWVLFTAVPSVMTRHTDAVAALIDGISLSAE